MSRRSYAWLCALFTLVGPPIAAAQTLDTLPDVGAGQAPAEPHAIKLWHGAIALGGLSALMLFDHPVQRYAQHNSGAGADHVAGIVRHFGQPEVTRAGGRLAVSLALAGLTVQAGKFALGRPRPEQSLDADGYSPFSGQVSLPSGHSAMAFAMATSLADEIHRPWAPVGVYRMASAVGRCRVN